MNIARPGAGFLGFILVLCLIPSIIFAQVTINPEDIPVDPGLLIPFYIQSSAAGIPVDLGFPGPNQTWDFRNYIYENISSDSLLDPDTAPFIEDFQGVNRVIQPSINNQGNELGQNLRYEIVADSGWYLMGLSISILEDYGLPLAFPNGIKLMNFPAQIGQNWALADTFNYYYTSDTLMVDTLRIEVIYGGVSETDAWGNVQYPGGEAQTLRLHSTLGLVVNSYAIQWLFGVRIELPLGEIFRLDATHNYTWYAPGIGEIANITSRILEEEAQFDTASTVRVCYLPPRLEFLSDEFNFNEVETGSSGIVDLIVDNNGDGSGIISSIQVDNLFENKIAFENDFPFEISPHSQEGLTISWSPQSAGNLDTYIEVYHNSPGLENPFMVHLTGSAWENEVNEYYSATIPDQYYLLQNYPNPFNSSTTIRFGLPETGRVKILVYDLNGREVKTLSDNCCIAGNYEYSFNLENLSSGVYFYKMHTPGFVMSRKMILVK